MQPRFERVTFPSAEGYNLDARLELPDREPDGFALFATLLHVRKGRQGGGAIPGAPSRAPSLLIGHSLGGAAVLAAAGRRREVCAVATIGSPFEPAHVARLFGDDAAAVEREGEATATLAERSFTIKKQLLDDIDAQSMSG